MNECLTTPQHKNNVSCWVSVKKVFILKVKYNNILKIHQDIYTLYRWHCTKSIDCQVRVRGAPQIYTEWVWRRLWLVHICDSSDLCRYFDILLSDELLHSDIYHLLISKMICDSMLSWTICKWEREREMFYLTTHSTHFIYGYMASDIWLRLFW